MTTPALTACGTCEGARVLPTEYRDERGVTTHLAWPCPTCCCHVCGKPCEYPPECAHCAADDEAAAKRRADQ